MTRRSLWRNLFLGALCLVPTGCDTLKSWIRHDDDEKVPQMDAMSDDLKAGKVIGSSSDDKDASSFFQNNRRSGGWSSEAREIESHMGAN